MDSLQPLAWTARECILMIEADDSLSADVAHDVIDALHQLVVSIEGRA